MYDYNSNKTFKRTDSIYSVFERKEDYYAHADK